MFGFGWSGFFVVVLHDSQCDDVVLGGWLRGFGVLVDCLFVVCLRVWVLVDFVRVGTFVVLVVWGVGFVWFLRFLWYGVNLCGCVGCYFGVVGFCGWWLLDFQAWCYACPW